MEDVTEDDVYRILLRMSMFVVLDNCAAGVMALDSLNP